MFKRLPLPLPMLVVQRVGRVRPDRLASIHHRDLRRPGKLSYNVLSGMTRHYRCRIVSELTYSTMQARPWSVPWPLDRGQELRKNQLRSRTERRTCTLHALAPNLVPRTKRKSAGFRSVEIVAYKKENEPAPRHMRVLLV